MLEGIDRPLAQLDILARDSHVLYRDERGLVQPVSGQRMFDFEPPTETDRADSQPEGMEADSDLASGRLESLPHTQPVPPALTCQTAGEWFREGCRFLDENEPAPAAEAFRMSLMDEPGDAEVNFHLAETLLRLGRTDGALERYYAAVEADHNYIEAWTQLGCLHAEMGELTSALEALQIAMSLHPEFPDANWHAADVLHQLGRTNEAVAHWRTYLKYDSRGPWAESARQRLEEAGSSTTPE